jgi:hypothetical protein
MSIILDGTTGINNGAGSYDASAYTGSYSDGIITDYVTGLGRITVGSADGIAFYNNGPSSRVETMRIDTSGNLGIGVTPSAWGTSYNKALQVGATGGFSSRATSGNITDISNNLYLDATPAWKYITTGAAALCEISGNATIWSSAPSGTAGTTATLTERMRIDTNGNVGIGTASPSTSAKLTLTGSYTNSSLLVTDVNTGNVGLFGTVAALTGAGTNNDLAISSFGSQNMVLWTNGSERIRIDSSGNVGIGNTNPSVPLTVNSNASAYAIQIRGRSADNIGILQFTNNAVSVEFANISTPATNTLAFSTAATERMRITSGGLILFGTTSTPWNVAGSVTASGYACRAGQTGAFSGNGFNINWTGSAALWIDTTNLGNIQVSSDYRIKRNIETQTAPALERIMALRPVTYQMADYKDLFKASEEIKEGFIAHEVQEVIPSGAEGQKDEEDRIQSLRVDAILSVAVKAIQEQQAMIESLTTRLSALESK